MCRQYASEFGCATVCSTTRGGDDVQRGTWDSMEVHGDRAHRGVHVEFEAIDRFGSGDAWFAGFLYGFLKDDVQHALDFGNALCALAQTREGDVVQVGGPKWRRSCRVTLHSVPRRGPQVVDCRAPRRTQPRRTRVPPGLRLRCESILQRPS